MKMLKLVLTWPVVVVASLFIFGVYLILAGVIAVVGVHILLWVVKYVILPLEWLWELGVWIVSQFSSLLT